MQASPQDLLNCTLRKLRLLSSTLLPVLLVATYFFEVDYSSLVESNLTTEKLTALLQRRARLDEQIAAAKRAESEAMRRADARRKIVVGGALLALARRDPGARLWLRDALYRTLSERDRALFALGDPGAGDLVLTASVPATPGATETAQGGGWDERGLTG